MCDILGYEGEWALAISATRDWMSERTRIWQCLEDLEQMYRHNNECVVDGGTDEEYLYTSWVTLADGSLKEGWSFGENYVDDGGLTKLERAFQTEAATKAGGFLLWRRKAPEGDLPTNGGAAQSRAFRTTEHLGRCRRGRDRVGRCVAGG